MSSMALNGVELARELFVTPSHLLKLHFLQRISHRIRYATNWAVNWTPPLNYLMTNHRKLKKRTGDMLLYLGLSLNAIVVSFHPLVPQIINCRFQVATNRFQIYNSRNLYLNAVFGGLLENFLRKFWRNLGRWGSAIWDLKSTTGQRTFIFSGNLFTVCTNILEERILIIIQTLIILS